MVKPLASSTFGDGGLVPSLNRRWTWETLLISSLFSWRRMRSLVGLWRTVIVCLAVAVGAEEATVSSVWRSNATCRNCSGTFYDSQSCHQEAYLPCGGVMVQVENYSGTFYDNQG